MDSSTKTESSFDTSDENMSPNANDANVTKQFKLRDKRVEYKEGVTKKFLLDSVQVRTPKRARAPKRKNAGASTSNSKRPKLVAGKSEDANAAGPSSSSSKIGVIASNDAIKKESMVETTDKKNVKIGDTSSKHRGMEPAKAIDANVAGPSSSSSKIGVIASNDAIKKESMVETIDKKNVKIGDTSPKHRGMEPAKAIDANVAGPSSSNIGVIKTEPNGAIKTEPTAEADVKVEYIPGGKQHVMDRIQAFDQPINDAIVIDLTSDDDEEKFEPDAHSTKIKDEAD